jgi:hypothetical protein
MAADQEMPTTARSLLRKLEGWQTDVQYGTFPTEFGGLSAVPDGNGKHSRVSVAETVDGVLLRAMHPDRRAFIALWIRRPGAGWKFDFALRGRRPDEYAPKPINSRELTVYVVHGFADIPQVEPAAA